MKEQDYLRLAIILSDSQASTFKTNLLKIVKLVLFDSYGSGMIIRDISNCIQQKYGLEFTDEEILNSIKKDRKCGVVLKNDSDDPVYREYELTPEEYNKIYCKENENYLEKIVIEFLKDNKDISDFSVDEYQDLILRYFYKAFNSDAQIIHSLINQDTITTQDTLESSFTDLEREHINAFLNWDNAKKNTFVFNVISCCYEYCMMTIKKDNNSFKDIFRGKIFYLDSNIIFRLIGLNKNERQQVMLSFINKCEEAGIELKYTNFTDAEIKNTIKNHVDAIERYLDRNQPISAEAFQAMNSKYANIDFYNQYVQWTKEPHNQIGDYQSFKIYLEKKANDVLKKFKYECFEGFEATEVSFNTLCLNFKAYKQRQRRNKAIHDSSIKIDINNFLFLRKKNESIGSRNFTDVRYYIITADHCYCEWAKEKVPASIPTIVLPSIWYSILLKYKGRSSNDYQAFCKFLNLRLSGTEEYDIRKKEILTHVLSLNESPKIKEDIIFDINNKLKNEYQDITDIESIVETSHKYITDKAISEAVDKVNTQWTETHKAQEQRSLEKAASERGEGYSEGLLEGQAKGADEVLNIQAKGLVKKNKIILGFIIIIILLSLFSVAGMIILILIEPSLDTQRNEIVKFLLNNKEIFTILTGVISAIGIVLMFTKKTFKILLTDFEEVKAKLIDKYNVNEIVKK